MKSGKMFHTRDRTSGITCIAGFQQYLLENVIKKEEFIIYVYQLIHTQELLKADMLYFPWFCLFS